MSNFAFWVFLLFAVLSNLCVGFDIQQFPSFGYQRFDKDSVFESQFALFGDAKVGHGDGFLQITNSLNLSSGRVIYRQPIRLSNGNPKEKSSFGTYFSFSLSPQAGDGLALFLVSNGLALKGFNGGNFGISDNGLKIGAFSVEFDTKMDPQYKDLNDNHVGIDVNSLISVKTANASKSKVVLNSGKKLQCWIDYEASSRRIEVRVSKAGRMRPIAPLLSCPVDFSSIFKGEEVWIGLSSSSANSTQVCKIYSWSFKLRPVPYWMHSQPLDPEAFTKDPGPHEVDPILRMHKKSDCVLRVLTAIIVGTGCGAMGALVVLLVWTLFVSRLQVVPEEFVAPKVEYDCDKMKVMVVDNKAKALKEGVKK